MYRPGKALRTPGSWISQNTQAIGTWMWQSYQVYAPVAFTPQEIPLVLLSVRGLVDPTNTVRPKRLPQWKILMNPGGIEPVTLWLVQKCLMLRSKGVERVWGVWEGFWEERWDLTEGRWLEDEEKVVMGDQLKNDNRDHVDCLGDIKNANKLSTGNSWYESTTWRTWE